MDQPAEVEVTSWADLVVVDAINIIGNYAANMEEPTKTNAVDIAINTAAAHNHTSFLWSIADIRSKGSSAQAAAKIAVDAAYAACSSSPRRTTMYDAIVASAERPIIGDGTVNVKGITYHTRRTKPAQALWDITHPAAPFLVLFKSEKLDQTNTSSATYAFISSTLSTANIQARAKVIAAAAITLNNP